MEPTGRPESEQRHGLYRSGRPLVWPEIPQQRLPIEVIHWLRSRRAAGQTVPGVYLCWELMVGNSNCRWYWGTPDGAPEPAIPWCGLLWPDGSPVSYAEAEAVHAYATGQPKALLFETFSRIARPAVPGWTRYPAKQTASAHLSLRAAPNPLPMPARSPISCSKPW